MHIRLPGVCLGVVLVVPEYPTPPTGGMGVAEKRGAVASQPIGIYTHPHKTNFKSSALVSGVAARTVIVFTPFRVFRCVHQLLTGHPTEGQMGYLQNGWGCFM